MRTTRSADGTTIAFDEVGDGDAIVIVGGAFSLAADAAGIAAALAAAGFRAVTMDRRARGSSEDKRGSTPENEADDLAAVIAAVGGRSIVLGHSSGAVLALFAASRGAAVSALFLSEPPFRFAADGPDFSLADRLQQLVDAGAEEEAVVTFQLEGVELPREMVESIRRSDIFPALVPLAQSTVYDAKLTAQLSTPTPQMLGVATPVTIIRGAQTFPLLTAAADRLAREMTSAELVIVPESAMHRLDPEATARVIRQRV